MARAWDRPLYAQPFDHRGSFQTREDCEPFAAAARAAGRDQVGCIVLGRGEDDRKVREWLSVARTVRGLRGRRTVFRDPLVKWRTGQASREQAAARIAGRYREFVDLFEEG